MSHETADEGLDAMRSFAERMRFDPVRYASQNPDVANEAGILLAHWYGFGRHEERAGLRPSWRLAGFDAQLYLARNPGLAEGLMGSEFASVEEHWVAAGKAEIREGRRPPFNDDTIDLSGLDGEALADALEAWLCGGRLASALSGRLDGLRLVESRDIAWVEDDRFAPTGNDGWLIVEPETAVGADQTGVLRLDWQASDPLRPFTAQVFIDYGDGFSLANSLRFGAHDDPTRAMEVRAADAWKVTRLRIDPDDRPNTLHVAGISWRAEPRIAADKGGRAKAISRTKASSDLFVHRDPDYTAWHRAFVDPQPEDRPVIAAMSAKLKRRPTFSFVMPVYNPPPALLAACLDSLLAQSYADFELCIADDASTDPKVQAVLTTYAARDARIKLILRPVNGHISAASNSALDVATGDFVVLVDHDDLIPDYALFVVALYLNAHPEARILFSDEDKITVDGSRFEAYFKGAFDPLLILGHNMVSHLGVYDRALLESIGGFRVGLEGSQDYDLFLRAAEALRPDQIVHIPHILYHWRAIPGSTAVNPNQKSYAIEAARRGINDHFQRTGRPFASVESPAGGITAIVPTTTLDTPVSILIPTRDNLTDLKACIDSITARNHRACEVIVIDNQSSEPETLAYLVEGEASGLFRVVRHDAPFNFSALNNAGAAVASGDILCLLNNDTEVITPTWLDRARSWLSQPDIGVVGARLFYPDDTLQHFGVVIGMGDHGVAAHPHLGTPRTLGGYFAKARLAQSFTAVTAACLFVRKADYLAVGGLDERLPVAYNDVDFCLRIADLGLRVIGDPDIELTHKESRTRGADVDPAKAARLDRDAAWMHQRWGDRLVDPYWSPNHDLMKPTFALAYPPRRPMPWRDPKWRTA